ncbi:unnamed protein product [Triticum aestivum]|uniref:CCHC-type domain-containing protein n=1 Tax=Triticum aestivum TaxID=4565 RepID=A0A7H4LP64_WHEAT|nr:unnamed protein product [Triticum aestivum]
MGRELTSAPRARALLPAPVAPANGDNEGYGEEMALTLPDNAKSIVAGMGNGLTNAPRAVLWASAADNNDDDEDDKEELAPQTPATVTKALDSEGICMGHDTDTSEGWQEVLPRRGPRRSTSSPSSMMAPRPPRPIPAWLHGRCCRCLAYGHRAVVCRDPLRCSRCLENGHRARECRNPWRPLSSLSCLDVPHVSHLGTVHRVAPASCEGSVRSTPPSKALHRGSWASVVSVAAGSATPSELMLQSALADQTALLQGCVARVESFLERAEVALGRLSLVPALLQTTLTSHSPCVAGVCSMEDRGEELYGSFSPRVGVHSSPVPTSPHMVSSTEGESIAVLVTPVLQIMPELRELCLSLSVEHTKVDMSAASIEGQVSPLSSEQLEVSLVDDAKGKAAAIS